MSNPSPVTEHLNATKWKSGQSGNPKGKPKGTKHLSTWIREMMEDENFEYKLASGTLINEAPVKAIVKTMIIKAIDGDIRAFDIIGKYGYGTRPEVMAGINTQVIPILGGLTDKESSEKLVIVLNNSDDEIRNNIQKVTI